MTMTSTAATAATVLDFVDPVPGLPGHHRFTLTAIAGADGLYTLQAQPSDGIEAAHRLPRLFLLDPSTYFPEYRPEVDTDTLRRLGTDSPAVLVVVHPATGNEPHAANLLAPVLVCTETGRAVQLVLENSQWPLRAPLNSAA